jgi:hypothetical protein
MKTCLLGQAHTRPARAWLEPTNDSREWMRALGGGDVLNYQQVVAAPQTLLEYDIAIIELTPKTHLLPRLIKRHTPSVFCLGLIEGRVEYVVRSNREMEGLFEFCRIVNDVDMLGVLVERTVPYYRLYARVPERVQWIGVPYPKDWTDLQRQLGASDRDLILELGSAMDSRNGIVNLLVLRELQTRFPKLQGRIYYYLERERQMVEALGIRADFRKPRRWRDYYRDHLSSFAVLCMDDRRTWGRYVLDCASAQMPFIGSALSHCGERVGILTCDPFDTNRALEYLSALIDEKLAGGSELHDAVTNRQYEGLQEYDTNSSLHRFCTALANAGYSGLAETLKFGMHVPAKDLKDLGVA